MIILFSIVLVLCILSIKKRDGNERDYMSVKMSNSIKGFFLCMVFFSHICGYTDFSHPLLDNPYHIIRRVTGQCIVTMFLFYSGYGIMESIKKRGQNYVKAFPIQRFLRVLLLFDCAILLFLIYRYLTGVHYPVKKLILTFLGWDGIGNSNWYIFCVLWLYIFTYVAFSVYKDKNSKAVLNIFILSVLYMAVMYKLGKEHWWYDTILCYSYGMFFSLYRQKIENFIDESTGAWLLSLIIFSIGYIVTYFYRNTNPLIYQINVFLFVAAITTFTMHFVIDNRILQWLGSNLFELYILQRLPMMILKPYILTEEATPSIKYIYVVSCFAITIIISTIYSKTISEGIKKITSNLQHL